MTRTRTVRGRQVPAMLYGTAWKEERTHALTLLALRSGFRGIDTANQRKHYHEAAVGDAVAEFIAEGGATREELFIQTKFTNPGGQDERVPYDLEAVGPEQVRQSFASSLEHLKTDYVDSLVLHGPVRREGLTKRDMFVWRAMEELHEAGKARLLGVSNVSLAQLTLLATEAKVKPAFVQNRCFARHGWGRQVRAFCRELAIQYQGFSLLTANTAELDSPVMREIAERTGATREQLVFRFALEAGMISLTGTSSEAHMKSDLAALDLPLSSSDMRAIGSLGVGPKSPPPDAAP